MVKRVVTSIITVAVLMGVLVACGDSNSSLIEVDTEEAKDETEGDVSFYMEQLEDYFRNRYKPSKGLESAVRVLGL